MQNLQEGNNNVEFIVGKICDVGQVSPHSKTLKIPGFVNGVWGCCRDHFPS